MLIEERNMRAIEAIRKDARDAYMRLYTAFGEGFVETFINVSTPRQARVSQRRL